MLIKIKVSEEQLQTQAGKIVKKGETIKVGITEAMEIVEAGFGEQLCAVEEEKSEAKGVAK